MIKKAERTIAGNKADLEIFCSHLSTHDKKTVHTYFRIAGKKNSFLVIRKPQSVAAQMQVIIVPCHLATNVEAMRKAVKGRVFHYSGWIRALPVPATILFVFSDILPQNELKEIEEVLPPKRSKKKEKDHAGES